MLSGCGLRSAPPTAPRLAPAAAVRRARAAAAPRDAPAFDSAAFDAERLAKDALSRDEAAAAMAAAPGAWKWAIRKTIWNTLEETDQADFPRPVHHRIPSFKGSDAAAARLTELPEFVAARCIKVNPDTPQRAVRFAALQAGKTLLTPQPRLRTGFFNSLSARDLPPGPEALREASTSAGAAKYGKPVGIDATDIRVDLIIVGSVAVCPKTGARIGKGEGFAELEYGMLRLMGAVTEQTLVVTSVHDLQITSELEGHGLLKHDLTVDVIVTPTRVIRTKPERPKPTGIYWDLLSPQKLAQVKVLRDLKARIEKEQGIVLPSGPDAPLPPLAQRGGKRGAGNAGGAGRAPRRSDGAGGADNARGEGRAPRRNSGAGGAGTP